MMKNLVFRYVLPSVLGLIVGFLGNFLYRSDRLKEELKMKFELDELLKKKHDLEKEIYK